MHCCVIPTKRVPLLTLLMVLSAVAVALVPRWSSWLIYDRSAILSGQLWRMWTGHWVHFSTGHLVCDAIPLGIAGWLLEARGWPRFGWFCVLAPWIISAAVLVFEPRMNLCGGLSGLATAMMTLAALSGLSGAPPWRWVCLAALLGMAGENLLELAAGHSVLVTVNGVPVVVSVANHLAGAATALVFWCRRGNANFATMAGKPCPSGEHTRPRVSGPAPSPATSLNLIYCLQNLGKPSARAPMATREGACAPPRKARFPRPPAF
jgi:rhomboid family GlyGly-CTERM serine protease